MSFAIPGTELAEAPAPAADLTLPSEDYTFHLIPSFDKLEPGDTHPSVLPLAGGRPGCTYFQCPTEHLAEAQAAGWRDTLGTKVYTIVGPLGQISCRLMVQGTPIQGASSLAHRCEGYIHPDISARTGLSPQTGHPLSTEDLTKPSGGSKKPAASSAAK